MVIFDDEIISSYLQISSNLLRARDQIKQRLVASTIDRQTRFFLDYLNSESLSSLSLIYKHSTIFMKILNNDYLATTSFEKFVDSLPNEFYIQKKQWKDEVAKHKLETTSQIQELKERISDYDEISNFVRWEKKLREDEVKEKEDPNSQ